jgi:hypothetical protein
MKTNIANVSKQTWKLDNLSTIFAEAPVIDQGQARTMIATTPKARAGVVINIAQHRSRRRCSIPDTVSITDGFTQDCLSKQDQLKSPRASTNAGAACRVLRNA